MLYAIIGEDIENSLAKRLAVREEHLQRLNQLQQEGRLILAGPLPAADCNEPGEAGFTGSLIVAEFNCLTDAKNWANNDPYMTKGVFQHVTITPFKQVLPS